MAYNDNDNDDDDQPNWAEDSVMRGSNIRQFAPTTIMMIMMMTPPMESSLSSKRRSLNKLRV